MSLTVAPAGDRISGVIIGWSVFELDFGLQFAYLLSLCVYKPGYSKTET